MQIWQITQHERAWMGQGNQALLDTALTAFFASRQCPGAAIRAAMDWALEQARAKHAVVSGFHSPLEQSVLKVLLAAGSPAVLVLARPVAGAKLPPEWRDAVEKGHLAVVSNASPPAEAARRLTQQLATERNALAAQLAQWLVVAYASPSGSMAAQVALWHHAGREVQALVPSAIPR
ncbi:MAG: DNA-processing protein DprA [Giesbergeria sp.]